jgi:hypothetical protein
MRARRERVAQWTRGRVRHPLTSSVTPRDAMRFRHAIEFACTRSKEFAHCDQGPSAQGEREWRRALHSLGKIAADFHIGGN